MAAMHACCLVKTEVVIIKVSCCSWGSFSHFGRRSFFFKGVFMMSIQIQIHRTFGTFLAWQVMFCPENIRSKPLGGVNNSHETSSIATIANLCLAANLSASSSAVPYFGESEHLRLKKSLHISHKPWNVAPFIYIDHSLALVARQFTQMFSFHRTSSPLQVPITLVQPPRLPHHQIAREMLFKVVLPTHFHCLSKRKGKKCFWLALLGSCHCLYIYSCHMLCVIWNHKSVPSFRNSYETPVFLPVRLVVGKD